MRKKGLSSKKKSLPKGIADVKKTDKQTEEEEIIAPSSFFGLFRFASRTDKFLLIIGVTFAIISGAIQPVSNLLFGNVTQDVFHYAANCANYSSEACKSATDKFMGDIRHFSLWNSLIGLAILITSYVSAETFNYAAIKQVFRLRSKYLKHLLNKDVSWYDLHKSGDFASRMADDLTKFEEGIGERVPLFIILQSTFFASLIMALVKGWELALICLAALPISMVTVGIIVFLSTKFSKNELDAYGAAGAVAEEVLTSIKTVVGFGGQRIEMERYDQSLDEAKKNNIKRNFFEAIGFGTIWFFVYGSYGLAFWFGVKFMLDGNSKYTAGNMITVFFSVMTGNMSFGISSPYFEAFTGAKAAAGKIFHIIDTPPVINLSKVKGEKLHEVKGNITFKGVKFRYPSRKEVPILQGLDLEIKPGETVALVGSSGCGKSTVLQLIQRFYDPEDGEVLVDGKNVMDLNLHKYRKFIGVVSQEPVLFDATIEENIRFGNEEATEEEIINASKMANAHNFIAKLPDKYKAIVGERGAQLSGGQKQRIAIARALVRNPAILLLDEATSALDTNSEAQVQAALDRASQNRTTVIVAHRLSTIKGANKIVVISNGKIVEQGTHNDLMNLKNHYYTLVMTQVQSSQEIAINNINADEQKHKKEETIESKENVDEENEMYEQGADIDKFVKKASLWSLMELNRPEWYFLLLGSIGGALMGLSMPLFAILFGNILDVIQDSDSDYVRHKTEIYCIGFVIAGVLSMAATFLQMYMFGIAGQKLTLRIRSKMFEAMLSQEMGYFDRKENGVGALCAQLSNEAAQVQGATGQRIGAIMNSFATLVFSLSLAIYYQWKLGLVALLFFPLIIIATFIQRRQMSDENDSYRESLKKSTKIAVEAVGNFKTVVSLGCEELFYNLYLNQLIPHIKKSLINTHGRAFILGFSRSIILFAHSTCMFYGGYLIKDDHVPFANVIRVSQGLIMGTVSIANSLAFTPNLEKGLIAAKRVMKLIHRIPKVKDSNEARAKTEAYGNIEYSKINFSYPTRDNIPVLKNLDLTVLQGKTVALVGPSGCGKSTIIQMIERFYDPKSGTVSLDDSDVKTITLDSLRSYLGIVSQEPNLFSRTIADNIAYGDNSRKVNNAEIIEAAQKANAHNFISNLPLGYDTELGEKGSQLSGGQKQRIAIARALIRNPKVLLLDEATSALDVESEKVVQVALDKAKEGRTSIVIAHRLSTIQDADIICVISDGKVAEKGTHKELIEMKGLYYGLHALQKL